MPWPLSQTQKEAFIQFLEPNVQLSKYGLLQILHFSFYSSQLKNLGQVLTYLEAINNNQLQGSTPNEKRYRDTLFTMGLIVDSNGTFIVSSIGKAVLAYCGKNNINSSNVIDPQNRNHALEIEKIAFEGLVNELVNGNVNGICEDIFKVLLYNAQQVYYSIPPNEFNNVISNEFRLYFLQMINSTGEEIRRFYRLTSQQRDQYEIDWKDLADDRNFPQSPPTDIIEAMVYYYCRTRAKSTLQYEIRFRVQAFLNAYHYCVTKLGNLMPFLDKDLNNLNNRNRTNVMSNAIRNFVLPQINPPQSTIKARHRIISGCPGSGKSQYIDNEIQSLGNSHIIKTSFHQESTYFDFVGTYKPTPLYEQNANIVDATGTPFPLGKPVINYSFVLGPLTEAYLYATLNPNYNVVLVIDEINRGNVGVIFGDFFQLLDRDNGATFNSKYSIQPHADLLTYLRSHSGMPAILDAANNHIKLPGNLFVWGTMNSADQGVFPIDSAFRRRWEFEYKGYNETCSYGATTLKYNNIDISWDTFREAINQKLLKELNMPEDKLIGPYFLTQSEIKDPAKVLNKLFLYLWEDVVRFQQKSIMEFNSFADLKNTWNNGVGKIFNFI